MKKDILKTLFLLLIISLITACSSQSNTYRLTKNYKPDDIKLYKTIVALDSAFFQAYNTCNLNLDKYSSFYAEEIEFYHDNGGFMNSKKEIVEGTKKNICGKVTRELVKGSIEVYPIKNFGAIEIGLHKFHNSQEPNSIPSVARFTIIWKKINNDWKIIKVISLH
ncbi:nuclear transport factor 2 family protein [Flavobacterium sp.]|uniref:nuclear transport factor 2 family protein n=1 Tax=Flavobacterium sp. TaxID=239 RepID=UPI003D6ADF46